MCCFLVDYSYTVSRWMHLDTTLLVIQSALCNNQYKIVIGIEQADCVASSLNPSKSMILRHILSLVSVSGFIPHSIQPIVPTSTRRPPNPETIPLLRRPSIIEPGYEGIVHTSKLTELCFNCFCCTNWNSASSFVAACSAAFLLITILFFMILIIWKSHLL